jgi:hypothetical protein
MKLIRLTALAGACLLAAAPTASGAKTPPPPKTPKELWATVNVCDSPAYPKMMGVRASMPGDGQRSRMYMRFSAQYYEPPKQAWSAVKGYPVSAWMLVGSGIYRSRQGGYTFAFDTPNGRTFTLRGLVDFKWVKRGRTIRTAQVTTTTGHPNTAGADPPESSAAICEIK